MYLLKEAFKNIALCSYPLSVNNVERKLTDCDYMEIYIYVFLIHPYVASCQIQYHFDIKEILKLNKNFQQQWDLFYILVKVIAF